MQYLFVNCLERMTPTWIESIIATRSAIILNTTAHNFVRLMTFLKYTFSPIFVSSSRALMDIWAVDFPLKSQRFQLNYNFLDFRADARLIVRYTVAKDQAVQSITDLFRGANWLEREVWDMFGIFFLNHPDLRRILTDYGFDGFPMRKDFPLTGYTQVRYDEE